MTPAPPPAALARYTGFLLAWTAAESTDAYTEALATVDFTPYRHGVMALLDADGPQKQARLSEQLDVFKPVMVRIVSELEARGWAERRPHPTDRRAVEVHILPAGAAALRRADAVAVEAMRKSFGALDSDEQQTLHVLLAKLAGR